MEARRLKEHVDCLLELGWPAAMEAPRLREYLGLLVDFAGVLERLSHAHEVQRGSCGARWPAARMQSAATIYGDGKRAVIFCFQTCSVRRWTRPVLDLVLDRFRVPSTENMDAR